MAIDELVQVFLEECEDEIRELEEGLIRLEDEHEDEGSINRVFRAAHTIKGSAGLVGFDDVSNFTHNIENILDRIRNSDLKITKKLISNLLSAIDLLKRMISASAEGEEIDRVEVENSTSMLKRFVGTKNSSKDTSGSETEKRSPDKERIISINMKFRSDILSTGQDPIMLIRELADNGEILETHAYTDSIPDFYTINPTTCYTRWEILLKTTRPLSDIQNVFLFVIDENEIIIEDISDQYKEGIDLSLADKPIGEILIEKGIVKPGDVEEVLKDRKTTGEVLVEQGKAPKEIVERMALAQSQSRKIAKASTIRVDTEKLDKLVNLVGEMVISVARMSQLASEIDGAAESRSMQGATASLERISRELQEQVMRVRMVPVEGTFNRFRRVVRDMSFELGKKIEIQMSGTETELDKNVIEQIGDPLMHMIRNSVDHGIESTDERATTGKPAVGKVWLRAFHKGGNIHFEIEDDGKGLDKELILVKAREKGLIDGNREMTDKEIFNLIFHPGFSTAKMVTNISGRGVGLDVVRKQIEKLNGTATVWSELGVGTRITIKLPLTLAIIQGLLIRVGEDTYAIPITSVMDSHRIKPSDIKRIDNYEVFNVRDEAVSLIRLSNLFKIPSHENGEYYYVVLVGSEEKKMGLMVDALIGEEDVVMKPLKDKYTNSPGIAGATILGDGTVSLIIDVSQLLELGYREEMAIREQRVANAL